MAKEETGEVWVNIKITDVELAEQLDAMVEADDSDRSKFIRNLIRREFLRRQGAGHWVGDLSAPVEGLRVVPSAVFAETGA